MRMGQHLFIASTTDCFRLDKLAVDESIHPQNLQLVYARWNRVRCTDIRGVSIGSNPP